MPYIIWIFITASLSWSLSENLQLREKRLTLRLEKDEKRLPEKMVERAGREENSIERDIQGICVFMLLFFPSPPKLPEELAMAGNSLIIIIMQTFIQDILHTYTYTLCSYCTK